VKFIATYRVLEELDPSVDPGYPVPLQAGSLILATEKAMDLLLDDEELVSVLPA
jgi:hypothetical protein